MSFHLIWYRSTHSDKEYDPSVNSTSLTLLPVHVALVSLQSNTKQSPHLPRTVRGRPARTGHHQPPQTLRGGDSDPSRHPEYHQEPARFDQREHSLWHWNSGAEGASRRPVQIHRGEYTGRRRYVVSKASTLVPFASPASSRVPSYCSSINSSKIGFQFASSLSTKII